jgi:hypothetical protein
MEAEKTHNLSIVNWRLRKTGPKAKKPVEQISNQRQIPSSAFSSLQALSGLYDARPHWEGLSALLSPTGSNASFIWKHFIDTSRNNA